MQAAVPLACFLSIIRPPGVQYENALLQIAPVHKSKCPYVKNGNDVAFQLFTRHNPTTYQELMIDDDEKLFESNINFNDPTMIYFHAFMEETDDGSGIMIREAYMQRGDTNVIMVDAHHLEAGPWYFTAAQNTWYIGRFAAQFIDYLVSRGLNLNNTHLVGHSLGSQSAGVAGAYIKSGRVARITGLDPALPLFNHLPLEQRLDPSDAEFVDVIHTDAGIFGFKEPVGHVDFYPNGGKSPQPGCELEVVIPQQLLLNKFFCSHWRSYMFYTESVLRPSAFVASSCGSWKDYARGGCARAVTTHMGYGVDQSREDCKLAATYLDAWSGFSDTLSDGSEETRGFYTYHLSENHKQDRQTTADTITKTSNFKYGTQQVLKDSKFSVVGTNGHEKRRSKRFLQFFKTNDDPNDTFLLRALNFLVKNRRNVLPVLTVMREINTLVKSANGELNHVSKESNNYIGALPSALAPATYSLELGNDSKLKAFMKRLLGLGPSGDRLTVNGGGI